MKKKILIIITFLIAMILTSIASAYAANYLYNSSEVYYDNSESKITSSDVQGAIDELYTEATNYSSINSRVTTLESEYNTLNTSLTNIGNTTIISPDEVTISSNTWTTVANIPLEPGTYILFIKVRFGINTTGYRKIIISGLENSYTSSGHIWEDIQNATSTYTYCSVSNFINVISSRTIYLNAVQTSGSSLDAIARVYIIRIK